MNQRVEKILKDYCGVKEVLQDRSFIDKYTHQLFIVSQGRKNTHSSGYCYLTVYASVVTNTKPCKKNSIDEIIFPNTLLFKLGNNFDSIECSQNNNLIVDVLASNITRIASANPIVIGVGIEANCNKKAFWKLTNSIGFDSKLYISEKELGWVGNLRNSRY